MVDPGFSVVMPARNTAGMIDAALRSALAQTRPDFELLVVDDGSTDGTAEVVERWTQDARVRLLRRERSDGPGAARNAAFAEARAPYVSMLDSDDIWLPGYLRAAGQALDRNPRAGLACTEHWTLEDPPGLVRRKPAWVVGGPAELLEADAFLLRLVRGNFVVNSTVTVRRSALEAVGGCNPALPAAVDFDLWLRLAAAGYGAVRVPQPLAVYRVRRGSIQNDPQNELRACRGLRSVYEAVAAEWEVPAEVRSIAAAKLRWLDRRIGTLTGRRPLSAALLTARRRAGVARRALWQRRLWYTTLPAELAAALEEVGGPVAGADAAPTPDRNQAGLTS